MFDAKDVDFATIEEDPNLDDYKHGTGMARGFAVSGGVAAAVQNVVKQLAPDVEMKIMGAEGLRECRKMMVQAKAGKLNGYLLEGMACPGGCVAGAGTIRPIKEATLAVEKFKNDAEELSCANSPYLDQLPDVEEFERIDAERRAKEEAEKAAAQAE